MPNGSINVLPDMVRWLYQTMKADAVLCDAVRDTASGRPRIYEAQKGTARQQQPESLTEPWVLPQNPDYPMVRFSFLSKERVVGNGARYFATRPLVLIEAIGQTNDLLSLETIAGRIEALFGERATGAQGAIIINGSHCERDFDRTEPSDQTIFKRLGGEYRFFVHRNCEAP